MKVKFCHLPGSTDNSQSGQQNKGLQITLEAPPPPGLLLLSSATSGLGGGGVWQPTAAIGIWWTKQTIRHSFSFFCYTQVGTLRLTWCSTGVGLGRECSNKLHLILPLLSVREADLLF